MLQARPYQEGDDSACFYAPAEFHIGQLNVSLLYKNLPNHFLMHYGYQFDEMYFARNEDADFEGWMVNLINDKDIISFLYSDVYSGSDHPYHLSR